MESSCHAAHFFCSQVSLFLKEYLLAVKLIKITSRGKGELGFLLLLWVLILRVLGIVGYTCYCFQSGCGNLPSVVSVRDRDVTEECDRARLRDNVTWVFVTGSRDKWEQLKQIVSQWNCIVWLPSTQPGITTQTQSANTKQAKLISGCGSNYHWHRHSRPC